MGGGHTPFFGGLRALYGNHLKGYIRPLIHRILGLDFHTPQVHAYLKPLTYEAPVLQVPSDGRRLLMGRHPECKVHRDDMHVSLQHFAIVGDHVAGWHLECLTPDGCVVVRERTVKMGRPRKLKHGDASVVIAFNRLSL